MCHTLRTFVVRTSARLLNYAHAVGAPPAALTSREITSALLSRPSINPGGKTHMNFLPVLPSTDTKSYEDMIKIVHHAQAHVGRPLVLVVRGDGQLVLRLRDLKRQYPALWPPLPPALPRYSVSRCRSRRGRTRPSRA